MSSPIMSPLSPLSPTGSKANIFRNRVPTQLRRCIPLYIACVCLILLILNVDMIGSVPKPVHLSKRSGTRPTRGFPKKIWQSWKVAPFSFEGEQILTARTWTDKNPGFRYEVLTDTNDMEYVEEHYGPEGFDRPDIVDMYRHVNATIIKADLLRYMIMYAEGGVYADIDVEDLRPVSRWIPERYKEENLDLVIGVEIDQPHFKDHPILGKKSMSFCQWTFMSRPHHPVMLKLVENIMAWLTDVAKTQGVSISEIQLDFDEVISGTGPSAFTKAVLEVMSSRSRQGPITWDTFHDIDESKVVSGILVRDVESFAAGQGHSDSGNHNSRGALVKHHYHASNWPSRHPRFRHPIFGEVERCNWNIECVMMWDQDIAAFNALSPDEQKQKVEEHENLQKFQQKQSEQKPIDQPLQFPPQQAIQPPANQEELKLK
ncbi:Initiation-specific alpha-1 6-mannosyltransferase [Colletotrichum gloeosporioides]|uniref:Initiation-specific alpha-1 6-mannosyltransferase n=1 Tax=Colletotrichum gloeosporioides TaxID=474922 RepID=A0A8H4FQQ4_COLGL|nr:Initiation-specific alpha-1 6-mannosyltransferase [Colletotrichum gloeosporioides]KAF3811083.1 Initiation-specific alpha-1 6-mannosyltransferase [Colletotrichum gloeosporioides]